MKLRPLFCRRQEICVLALHICFNKPLCTKSGTYRFFTFLGNEPLKHKNKNHTWNTKTIGDQFFFIFFYFFCLQGNSDWLIDERTSQTPLARNLKFRTCLSLVTDKIMIYSYIWCFPHDVFQIKYHHNWLIQSKGNKHKRNRYDRTRASSFFEVNKK